MDYENGRVKVRMTERGNSESNWLPMPSFEYDMPNVGDMVKASFEEGNYATGTVNGRYYHKGNEPVLSGKDVFYKKMGPDLVVKYNSASKVLEIEAEEIIITGNVTVNGNIHITGTATVDGDVNVGGNSNVAGVATAADHV